jgi:hypothetical protein
LCQLKAGRNVRFNALAPQHYKVATSSWLQCPPRPDRKATSRHGETQHPGLPGNELAQPARPVRLPSGPPSFTQVCTCRSPSMRRCGRSRSMSGSKSMISCWRVSIWHCSGVGIRPLRTSRPGRSGRAYLGAWTARSAPRHRRRMTGANDADIIKRRIFSPEKRP